jgi:hypothetical protein
MIGKITKEAGTVYLIYKGEGLGGLTPDAMYTYKEYAAVAGVSQNCMQSRLGNREYVTDWDLRDKRKDAGNKTSPWLIFEDYPSVVSAKYLRKKL